MTSPRRVVTELDGGTASAYGPEIPFSNDGGGVIVTSSPVIRPRATITVVGLSATLTSPGSTNTVVALVVNGVVAQTVTVSGGQTYAFVTFTPLRVRARVDNYGIAVTTAGTGAVGIAGAIELAG